MKALPNHITRKYEGIVLERFKHLPPGGKMGDLPVHLQHKSFIRTGAKKTGGPNMRLLRLEKDKPSLTVTAYIFNKFVHPTENRYITPREAACLQDFPLDWTFCGTQGQVQKQIGNAVPVGLAKAIAKSVACFLYKKKKKEKKYIYSYFTGAGGLDLGFEQASSETLVFETIFSTDIEEHTEKTIKANRPEWNFLREDIRNLSAIDLLAQVGKKPDIVIGGPPCQPFSVAGKQKATKDPLGRLYHDFVRHIEVLRPEVVVMENVYGLAQVKSENMIKLIYQSFEQIGYTLMHKELNAADYGVPQRRRRIFFIATLSAHAPSFQFPAPTHAEKPGLFGLLPYNGAGEAILALPNPILKS